MVGVERVRESAYALAACPWYVVCELLSGQRERERERELGLRVSVRVRAAV